MAYWRIAFTSRNGTSYEVRIGGASSGAYLTGGSQPFYIQEDDSRDIFKPARLQTGYIRFIDTDGSTWKEMIPTTATDRPVYLYNTSDSTDVLVWSGFIKPETYSGNLYEVPQEREFPIVCRLSILDGYDLSTSLAASVVPLYEVIGEIVSCVPSESSFSMVYFQGGSGIQTWLNTQINSKVFFDYSQDGEYVAKYSNLELLKELCTFFGWTVRTYGSSIYFSALDDRHLYARYYGYTPANLVAGSISSGSYLYVAPLSYSDWVFDASSKEEILQGLKRCTVTANIDPFDQVFNFSDSDIEELIKGATINEDNTDYYYYFHREEDSFDDYIFEEMIINTNPDAAYFQQYDYHKGTYVLSNKTTYNWTTGIHVCGTSTTTTPMSLETLSSFNFSNGVLVITADTESVLTSGGELLTYPGNGVLYYRLIVGDYVYNQTYAEWNLATDDDSWAELEIGEDHTYDRTLIGTEGTTGTIVTNRELDMNYPSYDGHGVAVEGTLGGRVRLEIKGCSLVGGLSSVNLLGLKIEFYRDNDYARNNERSNNIYKAESGINFCESTEIETFIATDDNNAAGNAIIMAASGAYLTALPYGNTSTEVTERPEEHLAARIGTTYGAKTHRVMSMVLLEGSNVDEISPASTLVDTSGSSNVTYIPVSISRDYYDDITKVIYVEI